MSFKQVFGLRESNKSKRTSGRQTRRLQVEPLEERQMLSVSSNDYADFDAIKAQYPDLNLAGDYNVIGITSDQLTDAALRQAIATAGTTTENDLQTEEDHWLAEFEEQVLMELRK